MGRRQGGRVGNEIHPPFQIPEYAAGGAVDVGHLRRSDHFFYALACLHWLRVPERIEFKIGVLTYKFALDLRRVTDLPSRRCVLLAPIAW